MRAQRQRGSQRELGALARLNGAGLLLLAVGVALLASCSSAGGGQSRAITMLAAPTTSAAPTYIPPPLPSLPPAPSIEAPRMILINPDTGGVYVSQNADDPAAMASTTKIMTALVAVTHGRLDQRIVVGADSVALEGTGASVAGLRQGDVLTLRELLYALLLPSGDDAAVAIADGVAGSQANFVLLMNTEAQQLGLAHTHYANPHGLDAAEHYSSAADLARLAARALEETSIATTVATPRITLPASADHHSYALTNTNELLFAPAYPGAVGVSVLGVKTGFTANAGYCLVFAAVGPPGRLIGVVMGDPTDGSRFVDARALLDWGFALQARIRLLRQLHALQPG
jgi:serine-type D-Ala-D-Ala carboxypeptidase (penicillin-binding protein 5/6)